jgi:hypothetical protein
MKPTVVIHQPYEKYGMLWGKVENHPRLADGEFIHTSRIIRRMIGGRVVTLNSIYVVDPEPYQVQGN